MERLDRQISDDTLDVQNLEARLRVIEETVLQIKELLAGQRPRKDWYTVGEVAQLLDRAEFTVREWCRLGRIYASKRECGRGNCQEWIVSREEIQRIENEGLLPL